jgi:hypothetical protein
LFSKLLCSAFRHWPMWSHHYRIISTWHRFITMVYNWNY